MKAILKYGWDNIKHQVLFTNLTEARAKNLVRSNPVLQFDLQGNFIKEYRSVKFAAESMGGSRGSLLNCLNPLRTESKTFKGYIWKYKNQ